MVNQTENVEEIYVKPKLNPRNRLNITAIWYPVGLVLHEIQSSTVLDIQVSINVIINSSYESKSKLTVRSTFL